MWGLFWGSAYFPILGDLPDGVWRGTGTGNLSPNDDTAIFMAQV